ncbi:MAG TPA: gephyrin-like molybdotransferase Glp [Ardenticatenaceae bacterium]|nr:gephyrin-like molybdotransferase Glp [Ardenticatenaceae bacterium]
MTLKPVDEALAEILSYVQSLPSERVALLQARGRVLAEEIAAEFDVPPFRNSAMDGYAVRAADTRAAQADSPAVLRVLGNVPAGQPAREEVAPGGAARIMTGAPLPAGADAVVRFEETSEIWPEERRPGAGWVAIVVPAEAGQNVREAGEDLKAGAVVMARGQTLRPAQIGVLAALGRATVQVVRRPRVAILATGDELVAIGEPLAPGKIRNSNEYTVAALVEQVGGVPVPLGIARDNVAHLKAKIHEGLAQGVDLFLTSAGVSVGDYDMVKDVLASEGEMRFWQVAIKPGKPLAFGRLRGPAGPVPLIGLPGNPVAAVVAFEVFARPAILKLGGRDGRPHLEVRARLQEDVTNSGRRHYMRARVTRDAANGEYRVTTRGSGVRVQGSGILSSLIWANAFLVVPEGVARIPAGEIVAVQMIDWPEEVF